MKDSQGKRHSPLTVLHPYMLLSLCCSSESDSKPGGCVRHNASALQKLFRPHLIGVIGVSNILQGRSLACQPECARRRRPCTNHPCPVSSSVSDSTHLLCEEHSDPRTHSQDEVCDLRPLRRKFAERPRASLAVP